AGRTTRWRIDPYADEASRYGVLRGLLDQSPLAGGRQFSDAVAGPLLATLKEAGLRGMGGAGFPTQAKWEMVRARTEEPKAIIVNADESEPGTFKDRVILHELPHLVVEGAIIAARVTGARRGIIYIRHEYEPERRTLAAEIDRARASGLLPASTGGHGTPDGDAAGFDLEIFVSPGGYILGEETALLEALEDRRGEPRNKPPFPVSHGLHGKPTVINNVETLAMVPAILSRGATWWREQGRDGCSGLKFIAVSGHVARPGVYEIESGTPIRELIETAGGVPGDRPVAAIAPGGASSPFLPPSSLEVGLDFAALQKAGSMLGSGALVVVAEGTDLLDLATNVVAFFRNESCGKCVPCRTGSEKAVHILKDLLAGRGTQAAVNLLPELGETLRLTSICGLGQVALNPILSVMKHFPELVPARLGSPPPARPR
ncbi:MAG: NADH-quinone oxidoreductase subunit F, partial [Acidobacteriota bacterium]